MLDFTKAPIRRIVKNLQMMYLTYSTITHQSKETRQHEDETILLVGIYA